MCCFWMCSLLSSIQYSSLHLLNFFFELWRFCILGCREEYLICGLCCVSLPVVAYKISPDLLHLNYGGLLNCSCSVKNMY